MVRNVDENTSFHNRSCFPGFGCVSLLIAYLYLCCLFIVPKQCYQAEISVPWMNDRACIMNWRLEYQFQCRITGNGRIIAELRNLDIRSSTNLSKDQLNRIIQVFDGTCNSIALRLEGSRQIPFPKLEFISSNLVQVNGLLIVICSKSVEPRSIRTLCLGDIWTQYQYHFVEDSL